MNLTKNIRYLTFPQLIDYDSMGAGVFTPYAMLSGPISYKSKNINTDKFGFRSTISKKNIFNLADIEKYDEVNILLGGSTAFGVGSTSDSSTITSQLSKKTDSCWLNLGIRGCNSLTEYVQLIRFIHNAKNINNIIFFSGMNDLYLRLVHENIHNIDPGFGTKYSDISTYHPFKQSLAILLSSIYNIEPRDLINNSLYNMIFKPFMNNNKRKKNKKLDLDSKIKEYFKIYSRNFMLYKGLINSLSCNVVFLIQPLIFWTEKVISKEEKDVLEYLNKIQKDEYWNEVKNILTSKGIKDKIINNFFNISNKFGIKCYDTNRFFNKIDQTCFVDSIHLSDYGNKIISNELIKILK
tara:strand:+ start:1400 stop:2455 length:1056 start_codon:yes stop_codon:yes gene_type:complete